MATLRKLPTMVAVAAFTAALSGCGGNDGKLVRDLEAHVAAAEADVEAAIARATAAEAARALAEMAQAEAETAAMMASSARMTAEQERDTATAAQMMAEEARKTAEMRQSEAEMAQAMAEEAQAEAEMAQAEAEMARETARTAQAAAEAAQAAAQAAAMEARADEEDARAAERAARMAETAALTRAAAAEAKSTADEAAKMAAETAQAEAEMAQMAAETARMAAEADKKAAETARMAAEADKKAAETARMAAEADEKAARTAQAAAETAQAQAEEDLRKAEERIDELLADLDRDRDAEKASRVAAAMSENRVGEKHLMRRRSDNRTLIRGSVVVVDSRSHADRGGNDGAGLHWDYENELRTPPGGSRPLDTTPLPTYHPLTKRVSSQLPFLSQDKRIPGTAKPDQTPKPKPAESHPALNGNLTTVSASHNADGMLSVSVSLPTTVGGDKYTGGKSMANADEVWNSAMLERSTSAGDETLMIYTDISAPTPTSFVLDNMAPVGDEATDYAARSLMTLKKKDTIGAEPVAKAAPIVLDSPPSPGTSQRYTREGGIARVPGSFGGVRGTYVCENACQFKSSAGGVVMLDPDLAQKPGVYFRPDDPSMQFLAPDQSYTYFGWWISEPNSGGDIYQVEGFSSSSNATDDNHPPRPVPKVGDDGNVIFNTDGTPKLLSVSGEGAVAGNPVPMPNDNAVEMKYTIAGTATYSGRAAGRYVARSIPERGVITDGEVGSFTADAELKADFGTSTDRTNSGVISGKVMGFEMSGDTDASGWELKLDQARLSNRVDEKGKAIPINNFTGTTSLSVTSDESTVTLGRWEGRFFDRATATQTGAPGTVIGTFDSHDALANITGAFGAKKQ